MKADVDYKKVLISEVAPDGGLGTQWKKITGSTRQGTASLIGSDADITAHKNVVGGTIKSSKVTGDNNFNFQAGDISAENRGYLMGGTVVTDAQGINYQAPLQTQDIKKSVMIIGRDDSVEYAVNVNIDAFIARADDDLAYIQVNGLVEIPEKADTEPQGSWDEIDADLNDILSFTMVEEETPAVITPASHTVAITVVALTDPSALIPTIGVSLGANATPNSLEEQDFTNPVVYSIENANGVAQDWTVTVTVTP